MKKRELDDQEKSVQHKERAERGAADREIEDLM
jgi:hypothetical protein